MDDNVAAAHGFAQGADVVQVAKGVLDVEAIQHPGLAAGAVKGAHVPASGQGGAHGVVADTAGGAQDQCSCHGLPSWWRSP
jgi:hypothetical protein